MVLSMKMMKKYPCGVISGPYFHEKYPCFVQRRPKKMEKGHIKDQRISDLKLLKTWVLAHFVCISCRLDHVAASVSTSFSVVKTSVFIPIPCEIHPATGGRIHAQIIFPMRSNASLCGRLLVLVNRSVEADIHLHCHCLTYNISNPTRAA